MRLCSEPHGRHYCRVQPRRVGGVPPPPPLPCDHKKELEWLPTPALQELYDSRHLAENLPCDEAAEQHEAVANERQFHRPWRLKNRFFAGAAPWPLR